MTDGAAPTPVVEVEDLCVHFPIRKGVLQRTVGHVRAVDGISFSIPEGTTLALVGESGCGKTTTGRCVLHLIEPTSGSVRFEGRDLAGIPRAEMRALRRRIQQEGRQLDVEDRRPQGLPALEEQGLESLGIAPEPGPTAPRGEQGPEPLEHDLLGQRLGRPERLDA